jgi:hypothetical protein
MDVARVHVRSWRAGYRGLLPGAAGRVPRWAAAGGAAGARFFAVSQANRNILFSDVALCEITSQQITCN